MAGADAAAFRAGVRCLAAVTCCPSLDRCSAPSALRRCAAGSPLRAPRPLTGWQNIPGCRDCRSTSPDVSAAVPSLQDGGAILARGNVSLVNTNFTNTFSEHNGGAAWVAPGFSVNANSIAVTNSYAQNGDGGALWAGSMQLTNSTFTSCSAQGGGGALFAQEYLYLTNVSIFGSLASTGVRFRPCALCNQACSKREHAPIWSCTHCRTVAARPATVTLCSPT